MSDQNFDDELERRLQLLEDPASDESVLDNLPGRDVVLAAIGLIVLIVVMLAWGYPR